MSTSVIANPAVRPGPRPVTPAPDSATSEIAELRATVDALRTEIVALRREGVRVSLRDIDIGAGAILRQTIVATLSILVAGALLSVPTAIILALADLGAR